MNSRAARSYRSVYLESASPSRVLDELYDRLIRDLHDAAEGIAARDPLKKGEAISHALAILTELRKALDPRASVELCAQLAGLYDFASVRLVRANVHNDARAIAGIAPLIVTLRDAFRQAAR